MVFVLVRVPDALPPAPPVQRGRRSGGEPTTKPVPSLDWGARGAAGWRGGVRDKKMWQVVWQGGCQKSFKNQCFFNGFPESVNFRGALWVCRTFKKIIKKALVFKAFL